jgi:hypothetical protein
MYLTDQAEFTALSTLEKAVGEHRTRGATPHDSACLHVASDHGRLQAALSLLRQQYGDRGYGTHHAPPLADNACTFVATSLRSSRPLGTLTVTVDHGQGLAADKVYADVVRSLRTGGARLAEVTHFAMAPGGGSRELFGSLFHAAFVFAHRLNAATDLLAEVTPRHAAFYARQLGFERIGEERLNPRVMVRGVLMRADLARVAARIRRHAGRRTLGDRSLYAYALAANREKALCDRLTRMQPFLGVVP